MYPIDILWLPVMWQQLIDRTEFMGRQTFHYIAQIGVRIKPNANYASVNEQSGIFAGDDGYQINVKNNTDLKGAIITSTQVAENLSKNSLDTGVLTEIC